MKRLDEDRKDGYMKLEVESDSDLWHLRHVVAPGDRLRMEDRRTTIQGGEKALVRITLDVEKTEYTGGRLRATGEIIAAPEDVQRGYHTFNLEPGVTFEIWKEEWQDHQRDRVATAAETADYRVVVCMIDSEEATFAEITETGIAELSAVQSGRSGKMYVTDAASEEEFYDQVISVLRGHTDADRIIVAGPGFAKENLVDRIDDPELEKVVVLEDASTTGTAGVQEVIKRGAVDRVLHASRVADEVSAVEALLERLNTDDSRATYGVEPVADAVEAGAVETLLITDELVREHEEMMAQVERMDGAVQIVHTDHDAGLKLASLGGVAALLRYRID